MVDVDSPGSPNSIHGFVSGIRSTVLGVKELSCPTLGPLMNTYTYINCCLLICFLSAAMANPREPSTFVAPVTFL